VLLKEPSVTIKRRWRTDNIFLYLFTTSVAGTRILHKSQPLRWVTLG